MLKFKHRKNWFAFKICSKSTQHVFTKIIFRSTLVNEPHYEKSNNVVSKQARHKLNCTSTEDGQRLEILDLEEELYCPCSENKETDQLSS